MRLTKVYITKTLPDTMWECERHVCGRNCAFWEFVGDGCTYKKMLAKYFPINVEGEQ